MFSPTQVQEIPFAGRSLYIKRDDLIHPQFSGNKARKFQYFLNHEFAHITKLIGYGSAQANSLYSLAVLAKLKGWQFDYYVSHISEYLLKQPQGNYLAALESGANIIALDKRVSQEVARSEFGTHSSMGLAPLAVPRNSQTQAMPQLESFMQRLEATGKDNELFIPEGGRCEYAKEGIEVLGEEILQWAKTKEIERLVVFFPSGTGTTAVYLQAYFNQWASRQHKPYIEVHTCSCVGGDEYLLAQFKQLCPQLSHYPSILNTGKKYHFGKLYLECYQMWQKVCQTGIEFELLYDPIGFLVLEAALQDKYSQKDTILYLHQGGVLGNSSMLGRYQRKYPQG